jgi:hypothetical protein
MLEEDKKEGVLSMRLVTLGVAVFVGFVLGIMYTVQANSESNLVKLIATIKFLIN